MKPEWCAQWAWDAASGALTASGLANDRIGLTAHLARALLDAHQRGRREGMEEAASVARCAFDDRPHRDSMDWHDGFDDGTKAAEYAIRAKAEETAT